MTIQQDHTSQLRKALTGNAAFSAVSGLAFVVAAQPLADLWAAPSPSWLIGIGLLLAVHAVVLISGARRPGWLRPIGVYAVAGDVGWVLGSALLLIVDPLGWGVSAKWVVAILADVVLIFAIWQGFGLRRMQFATTETAPVGAR